MSEQPQAGDVWRGADGQVRFMTENDGELTWRDTKDEYWFFSDDQDWFCGSVLLFRDGQPVPQPAPEPAGDVIEVAVMESANHDRHVYAAGQLGQTAAAHARFYGPDHHVATIRAVLPPRSVPVVKGTVTTCPAP